MKFLRFKSGKTKTCGILNGEIVHPTSGTPFGNFKILDKQHTLSELELLAPVDPSKIIAVGLNYIDHANELKMPVPDEPILFMKPPSSVLSPEGEIIYPEMCKQVDYEAELAVVIKNRAKNLSPKEAKEHILGYTCANDVTARDLQKKDGQWTRAKSFDTFSPLGPYIISDINPDNLKIELLLNGLIRQSSTTANMIFNVYQLLSFISKVMTLLPGDVVMTGTPAGVGPLQIGDTVEVRIEGIGSLINYVKEPL